MVRLAGRLLAYVVGKVRFGVVVAFSSHLRLKAYVVWLSDRTDHGRLHVLSATVKYWYYFMVILQS